jgi:hypothetical protein
VKVIEVDEKAAWATPGIEKGVKELMVCCLPHVLLLFLLSVELFRLIFPVEQN